MIGTISVDRIRGRALQRIRDHHLSANPLCVHCLNKGRVRLATQVDHIIALCNGGQETSGNRQSLCDLCHREKTALDLGHISAPPRLGCTIDGQPNDPNHPWNKT